MKEKIFNIGFRQFLRTPFSLIFFLALIGLCWLGKYLLVSKENVILEQKERIKDCDEERKHDKQLLQDLVFEKKRNEELNKN
jgi:hypothetical protein|tara:strand:- start:1235 stop:1480 length:246 start_codon:yes stop_codon:yes gene_type:complete